MMISEDQWAAVVKGLKLFDGGHPCRPGTTIGGLHEAYEREWCASLRETLERLGLTVALEQRYAGTAQRCDLVVYCQPELWLEVKRASKWYWVELHHSEGKYWGSLFDHVGSDVSKLLSAQSRQPVAIGLLLVAFDTPVHPMLADIAQFVLRKGLDSWPVHYYDRFNTTNRHKDERCHLCLWQRPASAAAVSVRTPVANLVPKSAPATFRRRTRRFSAVAATSMARP